MKTLVLLSGGLDSRLVCKILQEQLEVEAVYFLLPFNKNNLKEIKEFCKNQEIKLHLIDCTSGSLFEEYLEIVRHPRYSRGTALNPCIDCHLFILKKASKLAQDLGIKILATGEVLGERPLSQNKKALSLIDKELNFEVLRPLSAKLLEETSYETQGLVNRDKLLDIKGRARNRQIELARKYKINYPSPAGGCLLCEKEYCRKLKSMLNKQITFNNIKLLLIGRHFLGSSIILGRNRQENLLLEKQPRILVIPQQPGPTALIQDKKLIEKAKELIRKYSKKKISEFLIVRNSDDAQKSEDF